MASLTLVCSYCSPQLDSFSVFFFLFWETSQSAWTSGFRRWQTQPAQCFSWCQSLSDSLEAEEHRWAFWPLKSSIYRLRMRFHHCFLKEKHLAVTFFVVLVTETQISTPRWQLNGFKPLFLFSPSQSDSHVFQLSHGADLDKRRQGGERRLHPGGRRLHRERHHPAGGEGADDPRRGQSHRRLGEAGAPWRHRHQRPPGGELHERHLGRWLLQRHQGSIQLQVHKLLT